MKVRCLSCDTEIDQTEPRCPVCLRERTRAEMFGHAKPAYAAAKTSPGGGFRAFLLMATGVAAIFLGYRTYMETSREESTRSESAELSAPGRDEEPSEAPRESAPVAVPAPAARIRAEAPPPPPPKMESRPAKAVTQGWRVTGTVFDLLTLKPVAGARVDFTDLNRGKKHSTATDGKGRYVLVLPKMSGGGYEIEVRHKAYDGLYVEDAQPSFRSQDKSDRLEAYRSFERTNILHVPLLPLEEQDDVVHDLALLPPG